MSAAITETIDFMRMVMSVHNSISEKDLEEAFKDDPEFGMRLLYEEYQEIILRYIKMHAWGLQFADCLEVFQQTMIEFWNKTQSPNFDHQKPLALIFWIAKCRSRDMLRRKKHRANPDTDAILEYVGKDYAASDIGYKLRYPDQVDWDEFRQNLHEVIAELPERQLIVARVFVDNYEDFRKRDTYQPLATLVSNVTGKQESVVAVKSAWLEAKQKIVKEMTRRGFNFLEAE